MSYLPGDRELPRLPEFKSLLPCLGWQPVPSSCSFSHHQRHFPPLRSLAPEFWEATLVQNCKSVSLLFLPSLFRFFPFSLRFHRLATLFPSCASHLIPFSFPPSFSAHRILAALLARLNLRSFSTKSQDDIDDPPPHFIGYPRL